MSLIKKIKQKFTLKKIIKETLSIIIIIAVFFLIQGWMKRNMVEGPAPDFKATLLDGSQIELTDYRGKITILHFWAEWCPFCQFEESIITSFLESEQVITVAFQSGGSDAVQAFLNKQKINHWPTVVDNKSILASQYGVNSVPATYFIDKDGIIRFRTRGYSSLWGLKLRLLITKFY
ncbi:MAG TPA: protein disulfide oxidoreductase [Thiotrichaceae bacterium]|nr:protein disulfide oxidoreductase [Thiotrichaceae bacterium]